MFQFLCKVVDECRELHLAVLCSIRIHKTHGSAQLRFVSATSVHCMSMTTDTTSPEVQTPLFPLLPISQAAIPLISSSTNSHQVYFQPKWHIYYSIDVF